jgi:hypothetical protein
MITPDEAARQVQVHYPALTTDEAHHVAGLERDYPSWHVWPKVGYPDTTPPAWYARRIGTSPPALLRVGELFEVAAAIEGWLEAHTGLWPWASRLRAGQGPGSWPGPGSDTV